MSNLNIGIFGDSYAESYPYLDNDWSWAKHLQEKNNNCRIYAKGGTSTWYSYNQLKENIDHFDVIIFSFSYPYRFPFFHNKIPVNFQANLFTPIANLQKSKYLDRNGAKLLKKHQQNFWDYFSLDLLDHIHKGIVFEVNELCLRKNKKLIALFPFFTEDKCISEFPLCYLIDKNFPILYGVKKITDLEFNIFGELSDLFDRKFNKWDLRQNHLTRHNLKIYLKLIEKAISTNDIMRIDLTEYKKLNLDFDFSIENIEQYVLPEVRETLNSLHNLM